jgi:hypothetical protein
MYEIGRACSTYRNEETGIEVSFGQPEGKRSLLRYKHRWRDNIKMDSKETDWSSRNRLR